MSSIFGLKLLLYYIHVLVLTSSCLIILYIYFFPFFLLAFSAGLGVLNMAAQAISRMSGNGEAAVKKQFFLLDKDVWFYTFCNNLWILLIIFHSHDFAV